jgi:hypothetical protein
MANRSHFATNQEGWSQSTSLSDGKVIKLNAFTPLADGFGGSSTISSSGWNAHPLLWDSNVGDWKVNPVFVPPSTTEYILSPGSGTGSIRFYHDYDISNRSAITGVNMSARIQFFGSRASWKINDNIYIYDNVRFPYSGCEATRDYRVEYDGHIYHETYFGVTLYPRELYIASDSHNCISHPLYSIGTAIDPGFLIIGNISTNEHITNPDITIELLDNPSGDAGINSIYYDKPHNISVLAPNIVQITVDGLYECGSHYTCSCSGFNGTYISDIRHTASLLGVNDAIPDVVWDTREKCLSPTQPTTCLASDFETCCSESVCKPDDKRIYTTLQKGYLGYMYQSKIYYEYPDTGGCSGDTCWSDIWAYSYPLAFTNPYENDRFETTTGYSNSDYGALVGFVNGMYNINSNGSGNTNSTIYYHPYYGLLDLDTSIFGPKSSVFISGSNAILTNTLPTPGGYTNIGCVSNATMSTGVGDCRCSWDHNCISLLDPSKYDNGIVYLQNYTTNYNSGIFTLGRLDLIHDDILYSIPSGKSINIIKTGDVARYGEDIAYSFESGIIYTGANTADNYYLGKFTYSPTITSMTQNSQKQLAYPYGTTYQNISTYKNLDDFTIHDIDYEYGKGVNLLKLVPTGENFEFYSYNYYKKPTTYHKLSYVSSSTYKMCTGDNTSTSLLGTNFVGTQVGTYLDTVSIGTVYHNIFEDSNEIDIVYVFDTGRPETIRPYKFTSYDVLSGTLSSVDIYGYNFISNNWESIGTQVGAINPNFGSITSTYTMSSYMAQSGIAYIRYHGTGLDTSSRLAINYMYINYSYNDSPYRLSFNNYGDIVRVSGHNASTLPLVEVHWSGDPDLNNSFNYELYDIRPVISGDGTKIGFDNIYSAVTASTYWQDTGIDVSTETSGNVLKVMVDPAGTREDFSYYYRDNYYTKTHDFVDISGAIGRRWFIVYHEDQLVAYSGNKPLIYDTYTQQQVANITGTGLLVGQYYCSIVTPSFDSSDMNFIDYKTINGFTRSWTLYPYTNTIESPSETCCTLGASMTVQGIR